MQSKAEKKAEAQRIKAEEAQRKEAETRKLNDAAAKFTGLVTACKRGNLSPADLTKIRDEVTAWMNDESYGPEHRDTMVGWQDLTQSIIGTEVSIFNYYCADKTHPKAELVRGAIRDGIANANLSEHEKYHLTMGRVGEPLPPPVAAPLSQLGESL